MHGVYQILNTVNGKKYVGSSVDLSSRMSRHKLDLKKGVHPNPHLQSSWDKYGARSFTFSVLEEVENRDNLIEREQHWLDELQPFDSNGYNILRKAYSFTGYEASEEDRRKISIALKGKPKSDEHRANVWANREVTDDFRQLMSRNGSMGKGKAKSEEHKRKIGLAQKGSTNHRAKLTEDEVRDIKIALSQGASGASLSRKYDVSDVAISNIKNGKRWGHVTI